MAPPRIAHPPAQGDMPDIAKAIEALAVVVSQQRNAMIQQHEASMQRQEASLEQQQLVMQQIEAARLASKATQRQHMEAL